MVETEKPRPTDPLRQGDIIRLEDGAGRGDVPEFGVIINADCDLAHGKLDGVVAYLPMYAFRTYLARFWVPGFVREQRQSLTERIRILGGLDENGSDELLTWLATGEAVDAGARLSETCGLKGKEATELTEKLDKLRWCVDKTLEPLHVFAEFCRCERDPKLFARKKLVHAQSNMGDGHFFVNEVVGETDIGFVVRMRRIYTIDAASCFMTEAAQRASTGGEDLTGVRTARFVAAFRFKIAQLFAYQYSRIGLPDEIATLSSLAVDDMVMQLLGSH